MGSQAGHSMPGFLPHKACLCHLRCRKSGSTRSQVTLSGLQASGQQQRKRTQRLPSSYHQAPHRRLVPTDAALRRSLLSAMALLPTCPLQLPSWAKPKVVSPLASPRPANTPPTFLLPTSATCLHFLHKHFCLAAVQCLMCGSVAVPHAEHEQRTSSFERAESSKCRIRLCGCAGLKRPAAWQCANDSQLSFGDRIDAEVADEVRPKVL